MSKWDFAFRALIVLFDFFLVAALTHTIVVSVIRIVGATLATVVQMSITRYYEAKKEFLDSLTKEEAEVMEGLDQKKRSKFN